VCAGAAIDGQKIAEIFRRLGVSEQTLCQWNGQFGSMGVAEVRGLKQLEDENARQEGLVADMSLDKAILQDVLRKESDSRPAVRAGRIRTFGTVGRRTQVVPRDGSLRVGDA
jgi:putative transposase